MSLSHKALLVDLSISAWTGRKLDRQATSTVETTHNTAARVGNYTKRLLPDAKELDEVNKIAGSIRVWLYSQTLPWASEGYRILKSSNYLDFTAEYRAKKAEFERAVESLVIAYPDLKERAKAN